MGILNELYTDETGVLGLQFHDYLGLRRGEELRGTEEQPWKEGDTRLSQYPLVDAAAHLPNASRGIITRNREQAQNERAERIRHGYPCGSQRYNPADHISFRSPMGHQRCAVRHRAMPFQEERRKSSKEILPIPSQAEANLFGGMEGTIPLLPRPYGH